MNDHTASSPVAGARTRLSTKLMLMLAAAGALVMLAMGAFATFMYQRERAAAIDSLAEGARALAVAAKQLDDSARRSLQQSELLLRDALPLVLLEARDPAQGGGLSYAGADLAATPAVLDNFARSSGAQAAVLVREGEALRPIVTTAQRSDGTREPAALLASGHPAHAALLAGQPWTGIDTVAGRDHVVRIQPIVRQGRTVGALMHGIAIEPLLASLRESLAVQSASGARAVAVLGSGQVVGLDQPLVLPREAAWLQSVREAAARDRGAGGVLEGLDLSALGVVGRANLGWASFPAWNMVLVKAEAERDSTADSLLDILILMGITLLGVLVAGVVAAIGLRRMVTQPLGQALQAVQRLAGNDLSQPLRARSRDEVGQLMASLEGMRQQWSESVGNIRQAAGSIDTASAEIASGNMDLSQRTEQTASNLQVTAGSMHQLTATVRQSADAARQANQLVTSAADVAQRGGSVVQQVVSTMQEINQSSQRIADIIGVIDGIAFQTNILALNAAVEAARAGEQGRGFAVVAGEVRTLAQRSAQAAKEIKELINDSVQRVQGGARLVQDAGATMSEIVSSVQRVTDIIGEISAAANEQSTGIGQVNTAVGQLDQMTQQNAALVEESAAAAASLREQARQLNAVLSAFRTGHEAALMPAPSRTARRQPVALGAPAKAARAPAAQASLPQPRRHADANAAALPAPHAAAKPLAAQAPATKPAAVKPPGVPPAEGKTAGARAARAAPVSARPAAPARAADKPAARPALASADAPDDWESF